MTHMSKTDLAISAVNTCIDALLKITTAVESENIITPAGASDIRNKLDEARTRLHKIKSEVGQ